MAPAGPPSPTRRPARGRRPLRLTARQVVATLITVVVVFFVVQHRDPVHVEVVLATRLPLWLALTAAALLGTAVGFLLDRAP